jgi:hypothetical protein
MTNVRKPNNKTELTFAIDRAELKVHLYKRPHHVMVKPGTHGTVIHDLVISIGRPVDRMAVIVRGKDLNGNKYRPFFWPGFFFFFFAFIMFGVVIS